MGPMKISVSLLNPKMLMTVGTLNISTFQSLVSKHQQLVNLIKLRNVF